MARYDTFKYVEDRRSTSKTADGHHAALGLDERAAMREQRHAFGGVAGPGIWCWPRGSHADNPLATPESWADQQHKGAGSKVEKEVRLHGGFRSFSGEPVFDLDALERMKTLVVPGRPGALTEARG